MPHIQDGVRGHLLRMLAQAVEPMTNAELAKLVIAAGGISIMSELPLVHSAGLEQLEQLEEGRPYFWDQG